MSLHELIAAIGDYKYWHKEKSSGRKRHGRNFDNDDEKDNDDISHATREMLLQIASGVRHLHSLRIVHRDLKVGIPHVSHLLLWAISCLFLWKCLYRNMFVASSHLSLSAIKLILYIVSFPPNVSSTYL